MIEIKTIWRSFGGRFLTQQFDDTDPPEIDAVSQLKNDVSEMEVYKDGEKVCSILLNDK